jgi:adenosylcobinamide-phosphate synthase
VWLALDIPLREQLICLGAAFLWDRFAGEPSAAFHPVVWMGKLISRLTRGVGRQPPARELLRGAVVAVLVPAIFWLGAVLVLVGLAEATWLRLLVSIWLLKSTFALAGLAKAGLVVHDALETGDITAARVGLRSLCSRDASKLDEIELTAGAVESVAENASDSFVAPLFFYVFFGLPGAIAYRAVNTADAMIGYRGIFEYLGKATARFDDLLNFIPARLTALLLLAAGAIHGYDARRGWAILRRDGAKTESPNAGLPMAAMAGLLGVALAKPGAYTLGDADQPLAPATIVRAVRILRTLGIVALALAAQGLVSFG